MKPEQYQQLYGADIRDRKRPSPTRKAATPDQQIFTPQVRKCGYDPNWPLARAVAHWEMCEDARCQESFENYQSFKREMLFKYA